MRAWRNPICFFLFIGLAAGLACSAAGAVPISVSSIASIGEMRAQAGEASPVLQVLSYHPGLNRGGGLFVWTPGAAGTPDNCVSFAGKSPAGRWIRQWTGPLDATMCGAYWDNVHDDATVLTHAFAVAAALHLTLTLPGGTAKVCSTVKAAPAVIVRGQGMAEDSSPTKIDASCMKGGWVFELTTPHGATGVEAPKYYDMQILLGSAPPPSGCIRWNTVEGGFTDSAASQYFMMHPHAERINCGQATRQQTGLQCSKCFDGDFSQNLITGGAVGIAVEGSDVMCIGCAGPNRIAYTTDNLIRLVSHGTFGNMNRVVGNELLYPTDSHAPYDSFIYDNARSSTIVSNHIEGAVSGVQSVIHVLGGFSHTIADNDIDVGVNTNNLAAPHWLIANGPFVNFRAVNNGCAGCVLGPALFTSRATTYNGVVPQVITHGGNAANGDNGFPPGSNR